MAGIVVIFDFDSTIIECDSDNWVLDGFGLTENFYQLLPSMPWNPLMVFLSFLFFSFLGYLFPLCLGNNFLSVVNIFRIR